MNRAASLLFLGLFIARCSSFGDLGGAPISIGGGQTATTAALPSIANAADADHAEVALYVSMKFVEASVIAINQLNAKGAITPAKYAQLVGGSDSAARKVQKSAALVEAGIAAWRAIGKPAKFDANAADFNSFVVEIAGGVK